MRSWLVGKLPILAEDAVAVGRRRRREAEVVERATALDRELAGAASTFRGGEAEQAEAPRRREELLLRSRRRHLHRRRRGAESGRARNRRRLPRVLHRLLHARGVSGPQHGRALVGSRGTCRLPCVSLLVRDGPRRCGLRLGASRPGSPTCWPRVRCSGCSSRAVLGIAGPLCQV